MRMSELSRAAGVPVPTIKFYLREGLLPAGERTGATQAEYDEEHVARLRLIRALGTHAGLSLAATREILSAVDDPPESTHDLLGIAHRAVSPPADAAAEDQAAVRALLEADGWDLAAVDTAAIDAVAVAYRQLQESGVAFPDALIGTYLDAARTIAQAEVAHVPSTSTSTSTADAIAYVAVGVVLAEPLLVALRRLAQQVESSRRFDARQAPASD